MRSDPETTFPPVGDGAAGAGTTDRRARIEVVDLARAFALLAMVVYHFTWDLEHFGYVERGLVGTGGWRLFARAIASSFLFLVGVSLVLAHGRGIRWRSFAARLAQVAAGALAITIVTFFATPTSYVTFGILHEIAVASVLGLAFLFVPWWATATVAVAVVALPFYVSDPLFDSGLLNWIGFFRTPPVSNDFVPVFPFFGAVLAGIAAARLMQRLGGFDALGNLNAKVSPLRPLGALGRHSLVFYLVHQPVLFGLVFLAVQIAPPDIDATFTSECRRACVADRSDSFCTTYCGCAQDELKAAGLFAPLMQGEANDEQMSRIRDITNQCSFRTSR